MPARTRTSEGMNLAASALVAVVTSRRSVAVAAYSLMMGIRAGFRMAVLCAREDDIVAGIDVAIGALRSVMGKFEERVIEGGVQPVVHVVAAQAGLRVVQSDVVGDTRTPQVGSVLIVHFVAAIAIGRDCGEIVVYVTARARDAQVGAQQRENRLAVIETRSRPTGGAMAGLARYWKSSLNVIGIRRPVVVGDVTCLTSWILQRVIVVDVAGLAWHRYVRAS